MAQYEFVDLTLANSKCPKRETVDLTGEDDSGDEIIQVKPRGNKRRKTNTPSDIVGPHLMGCGCRRCAAYYVDTFGMWEPIYNPQDFPYAEGIVPVWICRGKGLGKTYCYSE